MHLRWPNRLKSEPGMPDGGRSLSGHEPSVAYGRFGRT
ncbi:hypothetical protein R69919_02300 [Paraburkholderia gardini]|nr:hypothetical protein R69919_02300 [Paraburkholderia gardini]